MRRRPRCLLSQRTVPHRCNSQYVTELNDRRTMQRNVAFASSVVASIPIVLSLTKAAVLRHCKHPGKDGAMRFEIHQPPLARNGRVTWRGTFQTDAQRVAHPLRDAAFGVDALK
jgi:hypothetical protein